MTLHRKKQEENTPTSDKRKEIASYARCSMDGYKEETLELQYKTRGMTNPQGKPRVYFACRQEDFKTAFPLVSEDLLRYANCAIWYAPDQEEAVDLEELYACLDEMQLVVLAVTSEMIHTDNRAKDVVLRYAYEHHIPILPILMETGLAREFNKATNIPIQVVNRMVNDPTATPYEEVLETYLKSVLIGDELAVKVRDAFDAYVFLSYRKKDRRYAQRLMHLIHENKQFQNIAIWYDEFLIPGEKYNNDIQAAFTKSKLFAMAVTPHLEEEKNYVMRVEYPLARDREITDRDFQIVPVEMYDVNAPEWRIDQNNLQEFKYKAIPKLQDEHRESEMNQAFLDALDRIAKKENDGSAQHRFFIGLAYLCGIDVEKNADRALKLIISAAEDSSPCFDATEKLADMYLTGDGVERNTEKAIEWQRKLCDQYLTEYKKHSSADEHKGFGTKCFRALIRLSDILKDAGRISEATDTAEEALSMTQNLTNEVGRREAERDTAVISTRLGSIYQSLGDLKGAEKCFLQAAEAYERLSREIGTARARRDLSIAKERLGDITRKQDNIHSALEYYKTVYDIRSELAEGSESLRAKRDLSAVLTKLGNVYKSSNLTLAREYTDRAYKIDKAIAEEERTDQAWDDLGVSLVKQGDLFKEEKQYEAAAEKYRKARGIFKSLAGKRDSVQYRKHYASSCEKLAGVEKRVMSSDEVSKLFDESVFLRQKLYYGSPSDETAHELAVATFNYGVFIESKELIEEAVRQWEDLCRTNPKYEKYRAKAEKALKQLQGD